MDIKEKIAIVTGGTGGIGFATVECLLKHGVKHVAMFDIEATKNNAAEQIQALEKEFGKGCASFYLCDVTKPSDFTTSYDKVVKLQKTVDILINNAGILDDTQGDRMIDINIKGVINCTLAAIDRMGKHNNGKGGTIVNVASILGLITHPAIPIYIATKHAVYGFTRSLKDHYEYTGIRFLTMCPGPTHSNLLKCCRKDKALSFVQDKFVDEIHKISAIYQWPKNVAEAIVKMIQEANNGAVWVSDKNEPPYAVKDRPDYKNEKMPV